MIRGATKNRKKEVDRFQNDASCEVFVGTLQAAGVGIDLTAASVLIHYDRWWNPAKENQATDRIYRIGQTKGVQIFKMIVKDSIEENINNLILKKMKLKDSVLNFDDKDSLKGLTREELVGLFQLLTQVS